MKEWHRTVMLLTLIAIGVAFILWTTHAYDARFVQSL